MAVCRSLSRDVHHHDVFPLNLFSWQQTSFIKSLQLHCSPHLHLPGAKCHRKSFCFFCQASPFFFKLHIDWVVFLYSSRLMVLPFHSGPICRSITTFLVFSTILLHFAFSISGKWLIYSSGSLNWQTFVGLLNFDWCVRFPLFKWVNRSPKPPKLWLL